MILATKHDWALEHVTQIYKQPFPDLIYAAQTVLRRTFPGNKIQRSTLLSLKSGGCSEDCGYCAQSAHHKTGVKSEPLLAEEAVIARAREALADGATRLCMGAAWRQVRNNEDFERVLDIVRHVAATGLEVCCTLGMLTEEQAKKLKDAGCHTYNHNLDTAPDYYEQIVTTHSFSDRLQTIRAVRSAGIHVCCGGIIGMGETAEQRCEFLIELANQTPHPENVPINLLIPIPGTPLADVPPLDPFEFVRTIATARIMMPMSLVRLSAGRSEMSAELQALCFIAGANSVFTGEKLLTAANRGEDFDFGLLKRLGMSFLEKTIGPQSHAIGDGTKR